MKQRITWPQNYTWMHAYLLAKPDAELEYKTTWNAMVYTLHGKIFALLLHSAEHGTLLNLKCAPYVSLEFRMRHETITPGWHMNKRHWISLVLKGHTPEDVCKELADLSYDLIRDALPKRLKENLS